MDLPATDQRVFYVAGLPRSGSTLLLNLLGQNPQHHVTPTNGLADLVGNLRDVAARHPAFLAQSRVQPVAPRVVRAVRGAIEGFYAPELVEGRVVFDKSRQWPAQAEVLDAAFGAQQRIILTLRDVRAVVASFERLYRTNPITRHAFLGEAFIAAQTTEGRARVLLAPTGVIGSAIAQTMDLLARGPAARNIVIPYQNLCADPKGILGLLHDALGLPRFAYDPENVQQLTQEDDLINGWGVGLHHVRPKVEAPTQLPWQGILSDRFAAQLAEEYTDLHRYVHASARP